MLRCGIYAASLRVRVQAGHSVGMGKLRETDLYPPLKSFLEGQGYEVKSEVCGADIVACRGDEDPVIVEMKTGFSLALVHQAIARLKLSDTVYIAVPRGQGRRWLKALAENKTLCRRLGLGLLSVRLSDGFVEPHLDPAPYAPRKSTKRKERLLREFARREGDPNVGGSTKVRLVTAYRQDAERVADHLATQGPSRGKDVADATGVPRATTIMRDDHYGWFERVARGVYQLTPNGHQALADR